MSQLVLSCINNILYPRLSNYLAAMITWKMCCVQSAFGEVSLPSESTDDCVHFSMAHCVLELMQVIRTLYITRIKSITKIMLFIWSPIFLHIWSPICLHSIFEATTIWHSIVTKTNKTVRVFCDNACSNLTWSAIRLRVPVHLIKYS